jgi:putative FmdB family regulatory protein
MPNYVYECSECGKVMEIYHSMSEERTNCEACGSNNTLTKIPEVPIYVKKKTAGNIVKKHIEDTKKQVQEEKQKMSREYTE